MLWEELGGSKFVCSGKLKVYRIVENQSAIYTRKLVDNTKEHEILEKEIEYTKPLYPLRNNKGNLHRLLFTPFRYPPLRTGTRFGKPYEQSIFYASYDLTTAMSEVAFRRFLFLHNSMGIHKFEKQTIRLTGFNALISSNLAVDLTDKPFEAHKDKISNPESYTHSQELGDAMRKDNIELFSYFSARKNGGRNVGVFSVEAFAENKPSKYYNISAYIEPDVIEFTDLEQNSKPIIYDKASFLVKDKFPNNFL
jgi:hypothetical protein